jgi:hypothetical protein
MEQFMQVPRLVDAMYIDGMFTAYVPESEDLPFWDALTLATERDIRASNELLWSVLYG